MKFKVVNGKVVTVSDPDFFDWISMEDFLNKLKFVRDDDDQ